MSQPQKTSVLAIVALVCIFFCWPLGLILGIVALVRINNSNGELGGKGLAIASIVVGAVMIPLVGIMAAIAIPNFIRYQLRSKASEARTNLAAIRVHQESFFAENGFYVATPATGGAGGGIMAPWDGEDCPGDCGPENRAACSQFSCIGFTPFGNVYYSYECTSTGSAYTCAAVADLDGNGRPGVYVVGSGDGPPAPVPDIASQAGCQGPVPAGIVHDCVRGEF
jgi:type IV pilus assembly protein PilA